MVSEDTFTQNVNVTKFENVSHFLLSVRTNLLKLPILVKNKLTVS